MHHANAIFNYICSGYSRDIGIQSEKWNDGERGKTVAQTNKYHKLDCTTHSTETDMILLRFFLWCFLFIFLNEWTLGKRTNDIWTGTDFLVAGMHSAYSWLSNELKNQFAFRSCCLMPDAALDMFVLRFAEHPLLLLNKIHIIFRLGWHLFGFFWFVFRRNVFFGFLF